MSAIAVGMNLFLAVLLMAALFMGWRLERRLRGVRDSHTLFAKAVADLDGAVARAQAGLSELRGATDESIDLLGGRLARAREAADRLEKAIEDAERVPVRQPAPRPEIQADAPLELRPASRPEPRLGAVAPTSLRGLLELAETARLTTGVALRSDPRSEPRAEPRARPRPSSDDDLFEDAGMTL